MHKGMGGFGFLTFIKHDFVHGPYLLFVKGFDVMGAFSS